MKLCLALVSCLMFAAGCKTDAPEPASTSSSAPNAESSTKPRSGKIEFDRPVRPRIEQGDVPALPEADGERRGRRGDPSMSREERRERWEERRKERQADLDANKDGTISPEEFSAAQLKRAEDMRLRFDSDGDGKLTVTELSESRMARRMDPEALDVDKNGEISAEELKASMDKMRSRVRGARGGRGWMGGGAPGGGGSGSATP